MTAPLLISLLAVSIALLGACIAWGQWHTAKQKLALDLFEKRFAAYNSLLLAAEARDRYGDHRLAPINKALLLMSLLFRADVVEAARELAEAHSELIDIERNEIAHTMPAREEKLQKERRAFTVTQDRRATLDSLLHPYLGMTQPLPRTPGQWPNAFKTWLSLRWHTRPTGE